MGTVWYAQQSSVNINTASLWNDVSDGSGNWLTWASLAADDTLRANGKTSITINVDTTCAQIDTLTSGGGFVLADGVTLTADVVAGTTACVQFASGSAAIVGDVTAGAGMLQYGVAHTSDGTLTITGDVTGGGDLNSRGVNSTGAPSGGTVVTGNVTGGSNTGASGIYSSSAPVSITGTVTGGTHAAAPGVIVNGSALSTIVGNVIGASAPGVESSVYGQLRFDGDSISSVSGITGMAARNLALVDGADHYTSYAEADVTPGDVTGELVTHYGENLFPTPSEIADEVWTYAGAEGRTLTG
jgi:hypothetical protein